MKVQDVDMQSDVQINDRVGILGTFTVQGIEQYDGELIYKVKDGDKLVGWFNRANLVRRAK